MIPFFIETLRMYFPVRVTLDTARTGQFQSSTIPYMKRLIKLDVGSYQVDIGV
jgi:hypothetical protein